MVGGLGGLVIVAGSLWVWLRRRRGKRSNQGQEYQQAPLEENRLSGATELDDKVKILELQGRHDGYERPELHDGSTRDPVEMQGESRI